MTNKEVINEIFKLQQKQKLSPYAMAKKAGITQTHFTQIMIGNVCPKFDTLQRICSVVGLQLIITKVHR